MHTTPLRNALLCAGIAFSAALWAKEDATAKHGAATHLVTPDQVQWEPSAKMPKGAEVALLDGDMKKKGSEYTLRIRMPDGYRIPPHFHPGDEHVTVLEGTFRMGVGDKLDENALSDMPVGSFHMVPKGVHHYGLAKGRTVVQVHGVAPFGITYVNPADDPAKTASR